MAESFGLTQVDFTFDALIGDNKERMTDACTIVSGEGVVVRGTLVGKVTSAGVTSAAVVGTGNGTIGSLTASANVKPGTYNAICVKAVTNAGDFEVRDPDGLLFGIATTGVAFTSDKINFTIADGSTDFALGDKFVITVAAGSGKFRVYNAANIDGSARFDNLAVLATSVDATSADRVANCYTAGAFNSTALIGYTAAMKPVLEARGIYIRTNLPNA